MKDQPYKVELINELPEKTSPFTGGAVCGPLRRPHLPDTGRVRAFRLLSITGAYWRGFEQMLQRIYELAFPKAGSWRSTARLEEAKSATTTSSAGLEYFDSGLYRAGLPI